MGRGTLRVWLALSATLLSVMTTRMLASPSTSPFLRAAHDVKGDIPDSTTHGRETAGRARWQAAETHLAGSADEGDDSSS